MGRKLRFSDEERLFILKELLVGGRSAKEIAEKYRVSASTLYDWKKNYF